MRATTWLLATALVTVGLAGCLGDEGSAEPDDAPELSDLRPGERSEPSEPVEPTGSEPSAPAEPTEPSSEPSPPPRPKRPMVVVAHIDTGVNPYHAAFRDNSPLAFVHPSRYLDGYPADTPALELTLDADTWAEAFEADMALWESVENETMYWIPGTKIVGAIAMGDGGGRGNGTLPLLGVGGRFPILDEHGHGTMTGSRSTGRGTSLAPDARLVTIEGLGAASVTWAASQPWIDVQTNSWGSLVPHPANEAVSSDIPDAFAAAAAHMITIEASGNGAGGFNGFAPCPTYAWAQGPPGVILVGGHDNGYVAPWSCSPPHIVADGFRPLAAVLDHYTAINPHGFSCCTSASAPYAASAAAAIILEARQILGHVDTGPVDGVYAVEGPDGSVPAEGPLSDGKLTLDEVRTLLFATAQRRPTATEHDGLAHWAATGEVPRDPTQPGDNQYCLGCWSLPIAYETIPSEVPAYFYVGYGAINIHSAELAGTVVRGQEPMPERPEEDELYAADQQLRAALFS